MEAYQAFPLARRIAYLLFPIAVLLVMGFQISHFAGRPYAPNEDWSVHWSSAQLAGNGLQPFSILSADDPLLDLWIVLFGIHPNVTRFLSTLLSVLCFALLFRLGADLFTQKTALIAVLLLGFLTVVQYFGRQAQPYAGVLMTTTGMHLLFIRWLMHPRLRYALLYGGFTGLAVLTYSLSVYTLLSQSLFFLIYILWQRRRALSIATLAVTALMSNSPVSFSAGQAIALLQLPIKIMPLEMAQILLLLALAVIPVGLRMNRRLPFAYPLTIVVVLLAINALTFTASPLYLFALLPLLALLAADTIHALPWRTQAIILALFIIPTAATAHNFIPGMVYQEVATRLSNNRLVVAAPYVWQHLPFVHYAADRRHLFHLLLPEQLDRMTAFIAPSQTATQYDTASVQRFKDFVDEVAEVWFYAENMEDVLVNDFASTLSEAYVEISPTQLSWQNDPDAGVLRKYVRIPDHLQEVFVFGDDLSLLAWQLEQAVTVSPCQPVALQSWWAVEQPVFTDLSMTLVLVNADDGQGIVQRDEWPAGRATSTLAIGQPYADERYIVVPCDIQPGEYPLLIGVYQVAGEIVNSLPVTLPDDTPIGSYAYLTTLMVNRS